MIDIIEHECIVGEPGTPNGDAQTCVYCGVFY